MASNKTHHFQSNWNKTRKLDVFVIRNRELEKMLTEFESILKNPKGYITDRFQICKSELNSKLFELLHLRNLKENEKIFIKAKNEEILAEIQKEEQFCLSEYQYTRDNIQSIFKPKLASLQANYDQLIEKSKEINNNQNHPNDQEQVLDDEKMDIKREMENLNLDVLRELIELKRQLMMDRTLVFNKNSNQLAASRSNLSSSFSDIASISSCSKHDDDQHQLQLQQPQQQPRRPSIHSLGNPGEATAPLPHNLDFGKLILIEKFYDEHEFNVIKSFNFYYSKFGDIFAMIEKANYQQKSADVVASGAPYRRSNLHELILRSKRELNKFHFVIHLLSKLIKKSAKTYSNYLSPTTTPVTAASAIKTFIRIDMKLINSELKKIDQLNLKHLGIHVLNMNAFDYFTHIRSLNLSSNNLKQIHTQQFDTIKELKELDLSDNKISELKKKCRLSHLTKLESLSMELNQLESLNECDLDRLTSLKRLNLSSNFIKQIDLEVFVHLTNLCSLHLSNNRIETLTNYMFQYLINLEDLRLNNNAIGELKMKPFSNLTKLKRLDLSSNKIDLLNDNQFKELLEMRELDLSCNQIVSVSARMFYGLENLKQLDLSKNSIEVVSDSLLIYMRSLSELNLRKNYGLDPTDINVDVMLRSRQTAMNQSTSSQSKTTKKIGGKESIIKNNSGSEPLLPSFKLEI